MFSSTSITFLGTSSAQPSSTRNHSSLALRMDSDVWLFDCGEATQKRLQESNLKMGRISKIFITHTHGDHIFGLLPLMASMMNGAGGTLDPDADERLQVIDSKEKQTPQVEIYGPTGTRFYVRTGLQATHTILGGKYVVHELRFPNDPELGVETHMPKHICELEGRNLSPNSCGEWENIFEDNNITVHAAPILHSVPCVGYVVSEKPIPGKINTALYVPHLQRNASALAAQGITKPLSKIRDLQQGLNVVLPDGTVLEPPPPRPGFKIAILGDTFDPSPIINLAMNCDLLVHEATNAHLPHIEACKTSTSDTYQSVEERCRNHGHSTPQMAGAFATRINAKELVLNHFSARYPGDDNINEESAKIMNAIRDLAKETFAGNVVCARDLMSVDVHRPNSQIQK